MADYYRRLFELRVGGTMDKPQVLIERSFERQFRIQFGVRVDAGNFHSYADISIYNLSRDTETAIFKPGALVALHAGYPHNIDLIFKGQLVNLLREKSGPDRITRIIAKGGAQPLETATIDKTFGPGVKAIELVQACASALGYPAAISGGEGLQQVLPNGYTLQGSAKHSLLELSRQFKFMWLVESDRVVVVAEKSARGAVAHSITQLTGMVGSPEITRVGADVVVKLNPGIKWGELFQVKSEFPRANFSNIFFEDIPSTLGEGLYKIQSLEHTGDSYGDLWDTRLIGIKAGIS